MEASNTRQTGTRRAASTAAAALVVFAALVPLFHPAVACSMPCCSWMAVSIPPMPGAACGDHCGMRSDTETPQIPAALVAQWDTVQIAMVPLQGVDLSTAARAARPLAIAGKAEIQHSSDAPLYLYNSVFLI